MSKNQLTQKAHAKINVGLKIIDRLPNGYHTLHSLFLEIDLHDTIEIEKIESQATQFSVSGISIPGTESNICERAVDLIKEKYQITCGVKIRLTKKIPIGAGLGGGSSDAAVVLKGLNKLWDLQLSNVELLQLAVKLGADVPFFINGGLQLAENIGDELTPITPNPFSKYYILLVKPQLSISTKWAYNELKKYLHLPIKVSNITTFFEPVKWQLFENDFERVILSTYPEVGRIKEIILREGACYASLSGSGSTMFGFFDDREKAVNTSQYFTSNQTFITTPV